MIWWDRFRDIKSMSRNERISQVQWLMPVISALWEAKEGISQGQEFKNSLTNMVKPRLLKIQKLTRHGGACL